MKLFIQTIRNFFGSRKNIFLPVAFCVLSTLLLCAVVFPVSKGISQAANTIGFQAPPSPEALFVRQPEPSDEAASETVSLADYGGMPKAGDLYGKVSVAGTSVECNLYYGDGKNQLHAGAGTFIGAQIPGQGGVTLVGAHTGTYFRDLESAQIGADVTVETTYGEYHYTISNMEVVKAEEFGQAQLDEQPRESLLLYTCYPFGQVTLTPDRYMVYCTYVSGPRIVEETEGNGQ